MLDLGCGQGENTVPLLERGPKVLAIDISPELIAITQQRLRDAAGEWAPKTTSPPQLVASAEEVQVAPEPVRADFHYHGDGRTLLSQVAAAYGVTATIDDSVVSRQVRFDIQQVDFYSAMRAACSVTRSFWTALQDKQILVANGKGIEPRANPDGPNPVIPKKKTKQYIGALLNGTLGVIDAPSPAAMARYTQQARKASPTGCQSRGLGQRCLFLGNEPEAGSRDPCARSPRSRTGRWRAPRPSRRARSSARCSAAFRRARSGRRSSRAPRETPPTQRP